jgi:hypothetical protein
LSRPCLGSDLAYLLGHRKGSWLPYRQLPGKDLLHNHFGASNPDLKVADFLLAALFSKSKIPVISLLLSTDEKGRRATRKDKAKQPHGRSLPSRATGAFSDADRFWAIEKSGHW